MKTEKQLTAVEWLCNEWLYLDQQFDMCLIDRNIYWDKLRQIQEQAKEMEEDGKHASYLYGHEVGYKKANELWEASRKVAQKQPRLK
jgi:hypothetical protein